MPAVGDNTSCRILIVITANGIAAFADPAQATTYDGDDDTLVGVVDQRPGPAVQFIDLASPTKPIFGFDGDGLCTQTPSPAPVPSRGQRLRGPEHHVQQHLPGHDERTHELHRWVVMGASAYFASRTR